MKYNLFYVLCAMALILQIEILMLVFMIGGNIKTWEHQINFNDNVIEALSTQCSNI